MHSLPRVIPASAGTDNHRWRLLEGSCQGISRRARRRSRLALGFALVSLLFIVYAIVSFLFVQHTVAGWSSLIAIIAILGAAQLLVLGIIGEYVGRILRETRKRPSYIVAETEEDRRLRSEGLGVRQNK